jgi:hypothetical protein
MARSRTTPDYSSHALAHGKRSSVAYTTPFNASITNEFLDVQVGCATTFVPADRWAGKDLPQSPSSPDVVVDQLTAFKWLNSKLESADLKPMNNLGTDLSDGVKLVELVVRRCPPAHVRLCRQRSAGDTQWLAARSLQQETGPARTESRKHHAGLELHQGGFASLMLGPS